MTKQSTITATDKANALLRRKLMLVRELRERVFHRSRAVRDGQTLLNH